MTITQTVEISADRRLFIDVPYEVPVGKAKVEVKLIPFDEQTEQGPVPVNTEGLATPISDSLFGILSGLGDINLDQIREERLAKYLK